ncbi:class I SAM-dependent methyltransferase [Planctomycetota bacterium]
MGHAPPPRDDWFDARALYRDGYPPGVTSALQVFPVLQRRLSELVRSLEAGFALEVGPGNMPVVEPGPGACYLELSHGMVRDLGGARVEGNIARAPFFDGMFDLVVAVDVFSHIAPDSRLDALKEMKRLAPTILIFNPEPGSEVFRSAPVPSDGLAGLLESIGCKVRGWPVQIPTGAGDIHKFGFILATR